MQGASPVFLRRGELEHDNGDKRKTQECRHYVGYDDVLHGGLCPYRILRRRTAPTLTPLPPVLFIGRMRYNVETMNDTAQGKQDTGVVGQTNSQHEPHEHAPRRVIIGITAVALVFILGGFIWSRWGDTIEQACFGNGADACKIDSSGSR